VLFTLNNTGPLKKVAPPCPKEGVIGKDQKACVDYEQSFRRDGDLFLPFLFNLDGPHGVLLIERAQSASDPAATGGGLGSGTRNYAAAI
jgi:hypothetical protein